MNNSDNSLQQLELLAQTISLLPLDACCNAAELPAPVLVDVQKGIPLSQALLSASIIDAKTASIIKLCEVSGKLDVGISKIVAIERAKSQIVAKVKTALIMPAITLYLAMIVTLWFLFKMIPDILANQSVDSTSSVINLVNSIQELLTRYNIEWYIALLATIVTLTLLLALLLSVFPILFPIIIEQIATLQLPQTYYIGIWCKYASIAFDAGMPMDKIIQTLMNVLPTVYQREFDKLVKQLNTGRSIRNILIQSSQQESLLPKLFITYLATGSETGQLTQLLDSCSNILLTQFHTSTDRAIKLINPLSLLFVSVPVLMLVVTFMEVVNTQIGSF